MASWINYSKRPRGPCLFTSGRLWRLRQPAALGGLLGDLTFQNFTDVLTEQTGKINDFCRALGQHHCSVSPAGGNYCASFPPTHTQR